MGSTGPASPVSGNPGLMADAMSKVGEAIHILQLALPHLPMGSEQHEGVLKMIQTGTKIAPPAQQAPGLQITQLHALAQDAQRQAPLQALMRLMSGAGGPGGGAPPMGEAPSAIS
jgi:hypothetical protein